MKLIIQIPCYNEETSLPITFVDLPKQIPGIDEIEVLVIDDGSTDKTVEVARALGIRHVLSWPNNRGLAATFSAGIEKCLELGADIIVNTDADNQYQANYIKNLVKPILEGAADMVVGSRNFNNIQHFSWLKKRLQKIGSSLVSQLIHIPLPDVASGFRAYSREAAFQINTLSNFSYTVENLIQMSNKGIKIASVAIETNPKLRESRLFKSSFSYITSQVSTLLRIYTTYRALRVFFMLGALVALPGIIGLFRFLYFYFILGKSQGHLQSLIFSVVFINVGFLLVTFGLLADSVNNNRKLLEKILYKIKKKDFKEKKKDLK